jgi:osmotically-inducible protein OsmY
MKEALRMAEYTPATSRRRIRMLAALALILAAFAGAYVYADRLPLHDVGLRNIGKTLSNFRDTSLDAALEAKVRSALLLSRRVSGMQVDVSAHAGVVTLAGRVPSREARSIVEAIAADTPGVTGVDNGLVVDARASASGYEGTLLQRIADLETQVALQERLRGEPLLVSAKLKVDVERGVVALRGFVESELERSSAQQLAEAAVGAEHVRNELETLSPAAGEDRLARRVSFELYSTGAFDLTKIRVRSEAGRVQLEGNVRSEAERLLAARLAEAVPGVREVRNELGLSEKAS